MYINKIYVYNSSVRFGYFFGFFRIKSQPNQILSVFKNLKPNQTKTLIKSVWFGFSVWIDFYPNRQHPYVRIYKNKRKIHAYNK